MSRKKDNERGAPLVVESFSVRRDDKGALKGEITLVNRGARTIQAYGSVRGLLFDPATKLLTVLLSDQRLLGVQHASHFLLPRAVAVDPGGKRLVEVPLPEVITRLTPGPDPRAPALTTIPLSQAETAEVEVAWSEQPFYRDPRDQKGDMREQFLRWPQGFAVSRFPVAIPSGEATATRG